MLHIFGPIKNMDDYFALALTHLCPANLRRDPQKISDERRDYESVDEKSQS